MHAVLCVFGGLFTHATTHPTRHHTPHTRPSHTHLASCRYRDSLHGAAVATLDETSLEMQHFDIDLLDMPPIPVDAFDLARLFLQHFDGVWSRPGPAFADCLVCRRCKRCSHNLLGVEHGECLRDAVRLDGGVQRFLEVVAGFDESVGVVFVHRATVVCVCV